MISLTLPLPRFVVGLLAWFAVAAGLNAQIVVLDTFDAGTVTGKVDTSLNGTTWIGNVTQNATSITVGGGAMDSSGWLGSGLSLNLTGVNFLTITAQRNPGHTAPVVNIQFDDAKLTPEVIFTISASLFSTSALTTVTIPITFPSGFVASNVNSWHLGGGTTGSAAFRMTFSTFSVSAASPVATAITTEPVDRFVAAGGSTTLTVAATGAGTLTYQWFKGGTAITGATAATLPLNAVALSAAGTYQAEVTGAGGVVLSRAATVAVVTAQAAHALASGFSGYTAGSTVNLTTTITYSGTPSSLKWSLLLPAGWTYASETGSGAGVAPTPGAGSLAEWTWSGALPASPITFTAVYTIAAGTTGEQALAGTLSYVSGATTLQSLGTPDPLKIQPLASHHSADWNTDLKLGLDELLLVIARYNTRNANLRTGCYDVATVSPANEDGFAGAPTRAATAVVALTRYHSADTSRDARLDLVELTRVIELYNTRTNSGGSPVRTGAYRVQQGTEDGFAAAP